MLIVQVCEAHLPIYTGRDHHDLAGLPSLFDMLLQLLKSFVIRPYTSLR